MRALSTPTSLFAAASVTAFSFVASQSFAQAAPASQDEPASQGTTASQDAPTSNDAPHPQVAPTAYEGWPAPLHEPDPSQPNAPDGILPPTFGDAPLGPTGIPNAPVLQPMAVMAVGAPYVLPVRGPKVASWSGQITLDLGIERTGYDSDFTLQAQPTALSRALSEKTLKVPPFTAWGPRFSARLDLLHGHLVLPLFGMYLALGIPSGARTASLDGTLISVSTGASDIGMTIGGIGLRTWSGRWVASATILPTLNVYFTQMQLANGPSDLASSGVGIAGGLRGNIDLCRRQSYDTRVCIFADARIIEGESLTGVAFGLRWQTGG